MPKPLTPGLVLFHEDHRAIFSAFLGIDGGITGPIELRIGVNKGLFDRKPLCDESVILRLRMLLPFLKSLREIAFVAADFA